MVSFCVTSLGVDGGGEDDVEQHEGAGELEQRHLARHRAQRERERNPPAESASLSLSRARENKIQARRAPPRPSKALTLPLCCGRDPLGSPSREAG